MTRNAGRHWLAAGLLAVLVGAGCAQTPARQVVEKLPDPKPLVTEKAAPRQTVLAPSRDAPVSLPEQDTVASIISRPQLKAPDLPIQQPVPSAKTDSVLSSNAKVMPAKPANAPAASLAAATDKKPAISKPPEKKSTAVEPSITQAKLEVAMPPAPRAADPSPKKTMPLPAIVDNPAPKKAPRPIEFVESSAAKQAVPLPTIKTKIGHADDYTWLCGQLQYWPLHKTWRLRYAGLDEVDRYGGSVTLADDIRGAELKDGQYVRVEGRLIDSTAKGIAPAYAVQSIHALDK